MITRTLQPASELPLDGPGQPRGPGYGEQYQWMAEFLEEGTGRPPEPLALVLEFAAPALARKFQIALKQNAARTGDLASLCQRFKVSRRAAKLWLTVTG